MIEVSEKPVAQGDLLIRKIDSLPDNVLPAPPEDGMHILAHSETGHHHAVKEGKGVEHYRAANDNLVAYLVVNNESAELEHMRSFDTHESYRLPPGIYELRRQIESGLEGFRVVTD